jgi:hypothetical protein
MNKKENFDAQMYWRDNSWWRGLKHYFLWSGVEIM